MLYEEIMDHILTSDLSDSVLPEGIQTSPLLIGQLEGETADCFFSMEIREDGIYGPIKAVRMTLHKQQVSVGEQALIYRKSDLEEIDFAEHEPAELYMKMYPIIRDFAFRKNLTIEQKKDLSIYCNIEKRVMGNRLTKISRDLFPEFEQWVESLQKQ